MTAVKQEVEIDAPRDVVWQYLSDPDLLAAWLMRNNFRPEAGSAFQFRAQPNDKWDGVLNCRLIDFTPPEKISFTWDANDIQGETLVTITLTDENSKTRLTLLHSNFENAKLDVETIVKRHSAGWSDHLAVLKQQITEAACGRAEPEIDWSTFDLHVILDAPPADALRYWATINGMEKFFVEMMRITDAAGRELASDEIAKPGCRFIWRWHNGRSLKGEYVQPGGENEIAFTFGDCVVAVRVAPYGNGTLLRLRQSGIASDEATKMNIHVNCRAAWVYFLTALKTQIEHGVDCRDKSRIGGGIFSTYFDPAAAGVDFDSPS